MDEEKVEFRDNLHLSIKVQSIKRYPIHWHKNVTEILLPIKGSIEVFVNNEHILVREGDFWFVNNKAVHSVRASPKAIVVVFHIHLGYFQRYSDHIGYMFFRNNIFSKTRKRIESDNFDDDIREELKIRFRDLLINIFENVVNNIQSSGESWENLESQLIHSMMREFHWLQFLRKKDNYISPFKLNRYHRIIKFIDENYENKITLKDVASREFVTKNYLSHFWKSLSHFSFQERLGYERTLRAELLLLTTDMSIFHISEKCGFSDVKYFYNHFKRWYGSMPLEHKKRCLSYEKKGSDYQNLKFGSIREIFNDYINTYITLHNTGDQNSMFSSFVKNCNKVKGVDRVIIAGASPEIMRTAVKIVKPGGVVSNVNYYGEGDTIPIPRVDWGCGMAHKTIIGGLTPGGRDRMERLIKLTQHGRIDPSKLITHRFQGFEHVEEALLLMKDKQQDLIKPIVYVE